VFEVLTGASGRDLVVAAPGPAYRDFLALRDALDPERVFDNAFLRQVLSASAAR
jgi:hypothetical protein